MAKAIKRKPPHILTVLIGFLIIAYAFMAIDMLDGQPYARDIDDKMRRIQIEDLLSDNQWHDLTVPNIAMPEAYISPWSRLVDAPYVLFTKVLSLFMPQTQALRVATYLIPPLLMGAFGYFFIQITHMITSHARAKKPIHPLIWAITFISCGLTITEFAPTRIDHHNMQFICLLMMIWGVFKTAKFNGYLTGLAIVLSISIGLELLPYILALLLVAAVYAIIGNSYMQQTLQRAGLVMCGLTLPLSLVLIGRSGVLSTQCDAVSGPWVFGLTGGGLILWLIPHLWEWMRLNTSQSRRSLAIKAASFALPSLVLIAGLAALYPICLQGPFHMIDDVSREFWLNHVLQENSLIWTPASLSPRYYSLASSALSVLTFFIISSPLIAFMWLYIRGHNTTEPVIFGLIIVTITAAIMTALRIRAYPFYLMLIPLYLPYILTAFLHLKGDLTQNLLKVLIKTCPIFISAGLLSSVPKPEPIIDGRYIMGSDTCNNQDYSLLSPLPAGHIIAPFALSFTLLEKQNKHKIVTNSFHRGSPGIKRIAETFMDVSPETRKAALAPFDYVAICRVNVAYDISDAPFYAALATQQGWDGLVDITPNAESRLRIFRIDHDDLPE